jgi:hypothetical protein
MAHEEACNAASASGSNSALDDIKRQYMMSLISTYLNH